MQIYEQLFIGGSWVCPASDRTIEVTSASTEQPIGRVPEAVETDVDAAVDAARRAFDDPAGWPALDPAERSAAMRRLAVELGKRSQQFAEVVSSQNGMPVSIATMSEAAFPALLLDYYAGLAEGRPQQEVRAGLLGGSTVVRHEPVGVVAAIVPWNFPQTLTFFKLAPALAAGCTVVVKPSSETPLDAFLLAEAVEAAGLPPGVVNIVSARRHAGSSLVSHPKVDKVAFTGSSASGREVGETCGRLLRPVTLELGGKSAAIVLDDAELLPQLEDLFAATLLNNGQTCYLGTRVLAPRSRYDDVVGALSALLGSLQIGDALDPGTQVGPMVSARHRERVESFIAKGTEDGATLVAGGGRPAHLDRGWFVEPTLFVDVDNGTTIAQEEIFGPVLAVIPYDGEDEAVAIANASHYGLGGSVWSGDPDRAMAVAARLRTGTVGVNSYSLDPGAPFGGVKASGLGRELGPEGLTSYQVTKSIYRK
jgi:aldehyde dehydrogenase (NAD+)